MDNLASIVTFYIRVRLLFMPYPLPPRGALRVVMSVPLWRRDGLKGYVPLLPKPNFAWKLRYSRARSL